MSLQIENYRNLPFFISIFWVGFFVFSFNTYGQKEVNLNHYSPSYFDSIRLQVYNTAREFYTIEAYSLSTKDEITIDRRLKESAWWKAEHKGNLPEKEHFPLIPMSEETEFAILYDEENFISVPGVGILSPVKLFSSYQGIFGTTYYEQKQIHNDYLLSGLLSWGVFSIWPLMKSGL